MRSNLLFIFLLLSLIQNAYPIDSIISPFERFNMEITEFIPTIRQEVDFANNPSVTDQKAQEQIRTLFPLLTLRVQDLRNFGLQADQNRLKIKEHRGKMCGQKHQYYYLKLEQKIKKLQKTLVEFNITSKNSRKMLDEIYNALKDWRINSNIPC